MSIECPGLQDSDVMTGIMTGGWTKADGPENESSDSKSLRVGQMDDESRRTAGSAETQASEVPDPNAVVNWDEALVVAGNDADLLLEVLEAFQVEIVDHVQFVRDSLASGDVKLLHRAAHTIKNICSNIGAQQASDASFELEKAAANGQQDQFQPLADKLLPLVEVVQQEVERYMKSQQG